MANREACELYIEQEIKSALAQGNNPYSIGKELSTWVEKLFETTISPRTIEQRARRIDATNVAKKSQHTETTTNPDTQSILETRHPQGGGKREGAGRPRKEPEYLICRSCGSEYESGQECSSCKPKYNGKKSIHKREITPKESIFEQSFKDAFDNFYREVQIAKIGKWKGTSREAALYYIGLLTDLITIQ